MIHVNYLYANPQKLLASLKTLFFKKCLNAPWICDHKNASVVTVVEFNGEASEIQ